MTPENPNYGKPGKHSWKIEGRTAARVLRRIQGRASSYAQKRAADDRAAALSEFLSPSQRRQLVTDWKRELSLGGRTPNTAQSEPVRAERRRQLKSYARLSHQPLRLVWARYQSLKAKSEKALTSAT